MTTVRVKTMHGSFEFMQQRLLDAEGSEVRLELGVHGKDGCQMSAGLQEFCTYYSTLLSYDQVADLVARTTGERLVCDQKVWDLVETAACALSESLKAQVSATPEQMPLVAEQVDIYSREPEVLAFADAILVTRQKSERPSMKAEGASDQDASGDSSCHLKPAAKDLGSKATASGRVSTDVIMMQHKDGGFEYLTAGIDRDGKEAVSLEDVTRAFVSREYGAIPGAHEPEPLRLVALSDGAKTIRTQFAAIFGHAITLILDWYHLRQRVRDKMSMVARNKDEKKEHIRNILARLWRGQTSEAIDYLQSEVVSRNDPVRVELIGYLQNHACEIIDYGKRRDAGKTIGSGRMEKGVDQVIGQRQKQKAMSWTDRGSKALAIIKAAILNHQWNTPFEQTVAVTG